MASKKKSTRPKNSSGHEGRKQLDSIEKLRQTIEFDKQLNKFKAVDILLERILSEARRITNAEAGSIYRVQPGTDHMTIPHSQNASLQRGLKEGQKLAYSNFQFPIATTTISGYVVSTGKAVNIPNAYNIPKDAPYSYDSSYDETVGYKSVSMLTVPLDTNTGEITGALQIINALDEHGNPVPFTAEDEDVITHFGSVAANALQRADLTRAILERMIKMAQLRDPKETGTHVNRVAGFATEIYERWAIKHNVDVDEMQRNMDDLRIAAMLHDVGKVAISDVILKKPARFNDEERAIMMNHALYGAQLFLDRKSDIDEMAMEIALSHHEHWNGKGYPGHIDVATGEPTKRKSNGKALGKKGEQIPLFGRIVAIADVYDALRSRRFYKEAWTEDDVHNELRSQAGKQFDPELIACFFEILPNIQNIARKYAEQENDK